MIVSMQININHCRVWLFYNEMGAVAQCPNNWGVGSAFHPKKIHILDVIASPCREGLKKAFLLGNLPQIWVGGVADSQTRSKSL